MALTARDRCVFAGQRKGGAAVIKRGGSPSVGCMAGSAVCSKPAGVRIILRMAGGAIGGRAFELQINMAVGTGNRAMLSSQFKDGIVMIKTTGFPAIGCMTGFTLRTQAAGMRICVAVTRGAIHWRTFEDATLMTGITGYSSMLTIQVEGEQGMIHCRILPSFRRMAGGTVRPKLTIVVVICGMAGDTFLRSYL